MSEGLAFGALGGAQQALGRSRADIDIFRERENINDLFQDFGQQTKKAGQRGARKGAGISILGLAALSALSGGSLPLSLLIGKGLLATSAVIGAGAGIGSRRASQRAARRADITTFDPKFHVRQTRRELQDVNRIIKEQDIGRGIQTAQGVFGVGKIASADSFLDFVQKIRGG